MNINYLSSANIIKKNWIRYIRAKKLGFFFYRRPGFKIPKEIKVNNNVLSLNVPFHEKGQKFAFLDLLIDDEYCLRQLEKNKIHTVLDIGANTGFFCLAARMQFQDAIIHAYEPNIDLKPYLEHQANFANAEVFFEAIGMAEGKVSLDFGEDSVHTKAIIESGGKIQQIAFKKAIDRLGGSVDLVKIDCEGGEWDILKDYKSWMKVDRLVMEYHLFHEHKSHSEIRSALKKINFDIKTIKELKTCGMLYAERNEL